MIISYHKTGTKKSLLTYRAEKKSLQILLSSTQARPGRKVKQEQEGISRNHVPRLFLGSVLGNSFASPPGSSMGRGRRASLASSPQLLPSLARCYPHLKRPPPPGTSPALRESPGTLVVLPVPSDTSLESRALRQFLRVPRSQSKGLQCLNMLTLILKTALLQLMRRM